ncbi:cation transporter [Gluconacetobacter azotocaptans]|uniref:Cation transporter n=1 Tax=Gluconacetobacter azotocaptans TaxID=142834 RepID=A0A7W4PCJ8_9PROT|nr:cation diffusion facilitator family transporter [Gluconacetobacter azotocaptans]MBB2188758.1 cation transporter [Gluconacetobacter azotocaptans]GBQ35751.1 cation efflux system protein [Gluconacetobacter azotocaptans DSM 13594]
MADAHDHPHTHPHDDADQGHAHSHDDGHGHGHDHGHGFGHHHAHAPSSYGTAFAVGITLNLVYVAAEATWGVLSHALALLADAGHNLSDVLALAAAWLAQRLSQRAPSADFTYGLRRSSILAALANAIVLLLVTGGIVWEAILRLTAPPPVAGGTIMAVAGIGILVNGFTALLFAGGSRDDLNVRGAFLHMAADALMSLAVVIAGGVILYTGWLRVDPVISLVVSAAIVAGTWSLLRDSLDMALDRVPRRIDRQGVEAYLRGLPGVTDLHDLHIWPISTTETALTVHLVRTVCPTDAPSADDTLLCDATEALRTRFWIGHPTFQIETQSDAARCILADAHTV